MRRNHSPIFARFTPHHGGSPVWKSGEECFWGIAKRNAPMPRLEGRGAGFTPFNGRETVHFIGIGGIGISALAQWFLAQKWAVSGSDISSNEILQSLQRHGVKVKIGHKKGNIPRGCALVIYTQAIKLENPELKEARRRKISILSYPEAVGKLTECYKTIAVAGAHGKSTATALVSLILVKAGFDPTVIIGTKLKEFHPTNSTHSTDSTHMSDMSDMSDRSDMSDTFDTTHSPGAAARLAVAPAKRAGAAGQAANSEYGSNFRLGKSKYLVLEADEYGKAFLNYSPAFTIVTNIDKEHLDFYKNMKNIKKSYLKFFSRTETGGALILNQDSKILFSLKPAVEKIAEGKNLKVIWYSLKNLESRKIKKAIRIAGEHNVSNALGAFKLSKVVKIPEKTALRAIGEYRGSWRRMEYKGRCQVSGVRCQVYDDYAHHPTEIKATLRAFREKFPKKKIIAVFQPHQAERLRILFKDFQSAFTDADITLLLPIYRVAGRDKINLRFTSEKLAQAIQKKQPKKLIFYLNSPNKIKKALSALLSAKPYTLSPILVMMGAGDIVKYTNLLLKSNIKSQKSK